MLNGTELQALHGHPVQVIAAQATGAIGAEQHEAAIGGERRVEITAGCVERNRARGTPLAVLQMRNPDVMATFAARPVTAEPERCASVGAQRQADFAVSGRRDAWCETLCVRVECQRLPAGITPQQSSDRDRKRDQ
ncbi:hypothetical protein D3C75_665860 [compost metagenome]